MAKYKRSWQESLVFAVDMFVIVFSYVAAYFIRFDGWPPQKYLYLMVNMLPFVFIARVGPLLYFKVHRSIRQYASIADLVQIGKAVSLGSLVLVAGAMVVHSGHPRSIFIIDWLLLMMGLSAARFIIRLTRPFRWRRKNGVGHRKKVLIVGAGNAGEMILREMLYGYNQNYEVVGLVDDAHRKQKMRIHGISIIGKTQDIPYLVEKRHIQEIIIAIPSLKSERMRAIVEYCIKSGAKYRVLPNIADVIDGTVHMKELRQVRIEDLLGRDEVYLTKAKLRSYITGKTVLVTGAGGSIGSELCRQVARFAPKKLVLFEKAENALFYIDMELEQSFKDLKKVPVVGDMCDRNRVNGVFSEHRPEIIFHAAAHKHVPLMEINSMEAIKNNVFGTKVLTEEAAKVNVERFIMLSTDKAADPVNLMGVSKTVAEMYVTALDRVNGTKFVTVRFGNVLDSEGSVIPTFKKQIEKGGPITITHPDIKRYFMTIPEAAGLVLEAGFMGQGGEIFILEMGKQIKIVDLAKDLIRLSALEPDDIEIVFTGLRPGEKMYEALVAADERLMKTNHEKILVVQPQKENKHNIFKDIAALEEIVDRGDMDVFLKKLKEIVPGYKPRE